MTLLVVLVVILTSIVLTNNHYARIEYEINAQLKEKAKEIARTIDGHLDHHKKGVVLTARSIANGVPHQIALENMAKLYPDFRTQIIVDALADVTHFYPQSLAISFVKSPPWPAIPSSSSPTRRIFLLSQFAK